MAKQIKMTLKLKVFSLLDANKIHIVFEHENIV